ncbi:hypothetical protein THIOSC13_340005 [uncultured Thiomicrorhabdus sp.]
MTCNFISQADYEAFIAAEKEAHRNRESTGSGPSYYRNKKAQISESFSRAVVSQALNGQLLLREAGDLLVMKPTKITKFAQELSI